MDPTSKSLPERLAEAEREILELRRSLENCQTVLEEREQDCERNREAARVANLELQHFSYAASHDLKEPLRTITTYTQLLQRQHAGNSEAAELTAFIIDAAHRINALIESLLNYSRTGAPSRRTAVNLRSLVQWVLLKLETSLRESGAQVTCGDLPVVAVDASQMLQVLENLLSNALKYRAGGPPEITVSAEESSGEYIISVQDNGVGIDPRYHAQIFLPFKRLHGREVPGVGLGLALCRKIIEGHGGRIWVESDGQHGSVFKFTLPAP